MFYLCSHGADMSDISKTCQRLQDGAARLVMTVCVSELEDYWLELQCCRGATVMPVRLIVQRQGPTHSLRDVLARMRLSAHRGYAIERAG
jgi:hypothetical protein